MKIYFIPGLGADHRIFEPLDLEGIPSTVMQWIKPQPNESLAAYAQRWSNQIDRNEKIVLIGVSFGGMLAQEMARIVPYHKLIIISSIKSPNEMPWQMRMVKALKLHKLFSAHQLKSMTHLVANYYFSIRNSEASVLLHQLINDADLQLVSWSVNAIMTWKNPDPLTNIIHIHGVNDKVFPVSRLGKYIPVNNDGHFMTVTSPAAVSAIILKELK